MFEQLKKAFSDAARNLSSHKEISERDLNNQLSELEISLLESDVAPEVVEDLVRSLRTELLGLELEKGQSAEEVIRHKLRIRIADMFYKSGNINLMQQIRSKKEAGRGPFVILLLGINGTGKTTTIAKIARLFKKNGISTVLAAADTHRAGAIEQLLQHGENLSIKVVSQRYGADPSAVGRDAVEYAVKHRVDTVLIDTAGRMQTAKNLMDEINKIVRVVKPDIKLFIGDSLAGNDTINQAREFYEYTNFDGAILTKTDADAKGGSAISIVHATSKPIVLIGMGQSYDDIIPFSSEKFLDSVFGNSPLVRETKTLSNIRQDITEYNGNRIEEVNAHEELPGEDTTMRTVSDHVTSEPMSQGIAQAPSELVTDSDDFGANKRESLDEVGASDKLAAEQRWPSEHEEHFEQLPQLGQQQEQKRLEEQPQLISVTPHKESESTSEKKESGSFFRGLFGKKSKTQVSEKDAVVDNRTTKRSAVESEDKAENTNLIEDKDKKTKSQKDEKEVVYLTDEDIEDLLK
ncbi:MAG TPA: signal recognition particle-docking protein FtsY [Nitrososphaeraceae archaeon]|nr:signal recognition particle-docking protein FtsY [Nitrososphaeraceae archaeon]